MQSSPAVGTRGLSIVSPLVYLYRRSRRQRQASACWHQPRLSPTVVANLLAELMSGRGGTITAGEVGLPIRSDGKVLPCGIYGRWEA